MAKQKTPSRDKIKSWMLKNDLSIGKAAKRMGLPKSTLANILYGTTPCLYRHAIKIANIIGVSWQNLVEE